MEQSDLRDIIGTSKMKMASLPVTTPLVCMRSSYGIIPKVLVFVWSFLKARTDFIPAHTSLQTSASRVSLSRPVHRIAVCVPAVAVSAL